MSTSVPMLEVLEALVRTALLHSVGNCKSLFVKMECVTKLDAGAQESLVIFQCHLPQDSSGGLKVFVCFRCLKEIDRVESLKLVKSDGF